VVDGEVSNSWRLFNFNYFVVWLSFVQYQFDIGGIGCIVVTSNQELFLTI